MADLGQYRHLKKNEINQKKIPYNSYEYNIIYFLIINKLKFLSNFILSNCKFIYSMKIF